MNTKINKLAYLIPLLISFGATSSEYIIRADHYSNLTEWNTDNVEYGKWATIVGPTGCTEWSDFDDQATADYSQSRNCTITELRTNTYHETDEFSGISQVKDVDETRDRVIPESRNVTIQLGTWANKDPLHTCSDWASDSSKAYSQYNIYETRNCLQTQEQSVSHIVDQVAAHTSLLSQDVSTPDYNTITRDRSSCYTMFNQDNSLNNGTYPLNGGSYYCDMSSGGWTRLASISSNSGSAGNFAKKTNLDEYGSRYTGTTADTKGFYALFSGNADGSYMQKSLTASTNGISWSNAKIVVSPIYVGSPDSFSNYHGNPAGRNDQVNGNFVDGFGITTGSTFIAGLSPREGTSEDYSRIGISSSQMYIGGGTKTINYTHPSKTTSSIKFRAMLDQSAPDEAIGFNSFAVYVK